MKLSGEEFLRVSQLRPEHFATNVASAMGVITTAPARTGVSVRDLVSPAHEAEARRVAELVDAADDVREDVVASLRERIEAGTYKVSGEQIAEMLIRRMMADRVR